MAENKSEQPTPKKLRDARKKGQIAYSSDITGSAVLLISLLILFFIPVWMIKIWKKFFLEIVQMIQCFNLDQGRLLNVVLEFFKQCLILSLPLLFSAWVIALLLSFVQVGPLLKTIKVDWKRINPLDGAKKLISKEKWVDLIKNSVKFCGVSIIVCVQFRHEAFKILNGMKYDMGKCLYVIRVVFRGIIIPVIIFYTFVAILDYFYQRFAFRKRMMMTKDEVKKEFKEMEGDPEIKSMRRQLFQELTARHLESDVRNANAVVVNPRYLAVVIWYDPQKTGVPLVSAKGELKRAAKIREYAKKYGIPIIQDIKLTRSLFKIEEGSSIPEDLYEAVAELLVFVSELSEKESASSGP